MKKLKFDNINGDRYLLTKGELQRMYLRGRSDFLVIANVNKGAIVEFPKK